MSIHTIGDSHSAAGWGNDIVKHHLGPLLCYSFGKDQLKRCDIRNFDIKNDDTVIFCLGEIDCRCHVHKHITDKITYRQIINEIINKYFGSIALNILTSQIKLKNVCVYNIVPPVQKHRTKENPDYPYLGTDEERKMYVLYFNKKLKEKCIEKGYIFFDVYNKYIDNNGFLRKDLSDGDVHIQDGIYLHQFIIKNNLLGLSLGARMKEKAIAKALELSRHFKKIKTLQFHLNNLKESGSWKTTAPLRSLRSLFKVS